MVVANVGEGNVASESGWLVVVTVGVFSQTRFDAAVEGYTNGLLSFVVCIQMHQVHSRTRVQNPLCHPRCRALRDVSEFQAWTFH